MMKFDVLTIFPEIIMSVVSQSIIGRALSSGLIDVNAVNIRDFSEDKHKKVDDYPYGGGRGMVMMPQPIFSAYEHITKDLKYKPYFIYMSPQGKPLNQNKINELKNIAHFIILCGHYEGVDERVIDNLVDEEISIGDYVLTGGELPALVLIDALARTYPGVLPDSEAFEEESLYNGLLEYPQYTRPYDFKGLKVPDVLLSGHHNKIKQWRKRQSLLRTISKRPDLFKQYTLSGEEKKLLEKDLQD